MKGLFYTNMHGATCSSFPFGHLGQGRGCYHGATGLSSDMMDLSLKRDSPQGHTQSKLSDILEGVAYRGFHGIPRCSYEFNRYLYRGIDIPITTISHVWHTQLCF